MSKRKHEQDAKTHDSTAKRFCPDVLPPLPPIDSKLERLVFTHPSMADKSSSEITHYDRLEFIGDAHLELLASNLIYDKYPTASAGRMAQIRQELIQNETLARYSIAYGFDKKLRINISREHVSKIAYTKIHGDVFEAYVGAIFRGDPINGPAQAETWMKALWAPRWEELLKQYPPDLRGQREELAKRIMIPSVKIDYVEDRPCVVHKGKGVETYFMGVYLTGWGYSNQHLGSGKANTKARAREEAALNALQQNSRLIDELAGKKQIYMQEKNAKKENGGSGDGES